MKLDRENMRKMKELIVFTIIILIALWNYNILFGWIRFAFGIIFPFILGGGIAFILNVPMSFLEEKIFYNRYLKDKKIANRLARPLTLVLTLALVIGVIVLVMFVVIPELTTTVLSLGKTIRAFVPEAQRFLEDLFTDNSEVRAWLDGLNLDIGKNGGQRSGIFPGWSRECDQFHCICHWLFCERYGHICYRLCICVLCAAAERKTEQTGEKGSLCIPVGKTCGVDSGSMFSDSKIFFQFFCRPVCRGCNSGDHVFYNYEYSEYAVCTAGRHPDRVYSADSYFRRVYRVRYRNVSDSDGGSGSGPDLCNHVSDSSAD